MAQQIETPHTSASVERGNDADMANSLDGDNFLKFMSIIKLDVSDDPAVMIDAAEEPPVATKSPTKERVNEDKKRGANEDDLGVGLVDCVAPAEGKIPAASHEIAYETPSNKEESDQDMAKSSDTIMGPAEKVCSEVIGGGEQPAKSNDVELHEWDLPGERRSSSVRELKSNLMTNSTKTVDSWGGKEGFISPLLGSAPICSIEIEDLSDLEDDNSNSDPSGFSRNKDPSLPPGTVTQLTDISNVQEGAECIRSESLSPPSSATQGSKVSELKEVAEYINIHKLMNPSINPADYSPQVNRTRQRLERVKGKKDEFSLDDSGHTKVSLLEERLRASAYRGPKPTKDGAVLKGVMKTGTRQSHRPLCCETSASLDISINSSPIPGRDVGDRPTTMRRCAFSFVDIREHERIAGDNPCVTSGVPLSIGWGYHQHKSIELDRYELNKGPPRDKIEMMVPAAVRRSMLLDEFGVSVTELNTATRDVNITKRNRRHTVATEHLEAWTDVLQSAKRKFHRIVKKTTTAKEQEKLWEEAHKNAMTEYLKTHGADSLGKNPGSAGVGSINKGPIIIPEKNSQF